VVGYPDIFPASLVGGSNPCPGSAVLEPLLTTAELTGLRALAHELDQTIDAAAKRARVTYVDTESAFAGHELCTADSWVYGIDLRNGGSLHPTARGQLALAARVSAAIDH
jgi:hypothetical protein